ncbi:MAG: SulP family inorganic anion transporter [Gemmataceae bacterium]
MERPSALPMSTKEEPAPPVESLPPEEPIGEDHGKPTGWKTTLLRLFPAIDSLRTYSLASFRLDFLAGLTVAAVAVPQAMAYATIAGLPPQYGLYTAIVMTAVGALFDSSKQLINGPTNAISIALLSALALIPVEQKVPAAILMAFLIGAFQTSITLFRLGDLTRFISHAVIVGFTLGAAVLLAMDQLKNLFGLAPIGNPHDHFLVRFGLTMAGIRDFNGWTLALGLGAIAISLGLAAVSRRIGVRLPEFLLAVIASAYVVWQFDLVARGVSVVGNIPPHLPSFQLPEFDGTWIRQLSGSALALAVLGLLEAIAMAKAIASRTKQRLDINQQCLSEGLANLTGSFFQCFPGSGSLTRSAINVQAGAVSQWSGVFAAIAVALTMLFFAPFARYIPRSALAGILLVSAWRLVDRKQLSYHLRTTRFDAGIVLVTAIAAVAISVEFCILIGIFLSFVLFVPRAARIRMNELVVTPERVLRERIPSDPQCNKLRIFDLEGELFFGAAPDLERHFDNVTSIAIKNDVRFVVIRLKHARNPDAVCIERLESFLETMEHCGVQVYLCGVRRDLAKALHRSGLDHKIGTNRIFREGTAAFSSTLEAVLHAYGELGSDVCPTCPRRSEVPRETLYYMI